MTRPVVRCRCGHRVLAKEVLRTDLYERPSGREYVYVKYRCKHCKRLGETFVAETRWDWRIFETTRSEMSELESADFDDQAPISSEEVITFHRQLAALDDSTELASHFDSVNETSTPPDPKSAEPTSAKLWPEALRESKNDGKGEAKARPRENGARDESAHHNHPPRDN